MDRPGSPDRDPRMFVVRPVTAVLLGYRNYRLGSYRTVIDPGAALERDDFFFESSFRSIFLFEHDLFGKPVPTFQDHAPRGVCGIARNL
jgi:hypothetical protein